MRRARVPGGRRAVRPALAVGVVLALLVSAFGGVALASPRSAPVPTGGSGPGPRGAGAPGAAPPNPYTMGMAASLVLGQSGFTTGGSGTTSATLQIPFAAAFDAAGDLWVVDTQNNRVLKFLPPFVTGEAANLVLGQPSFTSRTAATSPVGMWEPQGIAVSPSGDVWVADSTNNRVLEFRPPFSTGMPASVVLGQTSFTLNRAGTGPANLTHPIGLAFDSLGDLFVADSGNNRVLEFRPPFSDDMAASLVLGQTNFSGNQSNTTSVNLSLPYGVAVGPQGELWVADFENYRAVGFYPPLSSGMAASVVLGQPNFTTINETGADATGQPTGVSFDEAGDLWIAEPGAPDRVAEYLPPLATNETPTLAIGQANLTTPVRGTSATLVDGPSGVAFDGSDNLWVADSGNDRVLEYTPPTFAVTFAETGLPSGTAWSVTLNGVTRSTNTNATTFQVANGSYAYTVGSVGGYRDSPAAGTVAENGTPQTIRITFSSSPSPGIPPTVLALVVAIVLLAVIAGALLARRRRRRPPGPSPPGGPPGTGAGEAPGPIRPAPPSGPPGPTPPPAS